MGKKETSFANFKEGNKYSIDESNFGQLHSVASAKTEREALAVVKLIGKSNPRKTYYVMEAKNPEAPDASYYRFKKGRLKKLV